MNKFFNEISIVFSFVGGGVSYFLGGFDTALTFLLSMIVIDYLTGIAKSYFSHTLNSNVGYLGIYKKIAILVVVGLAVMIDHLAGDNTPIREMVIFFYIANEGISIIENLSEYTPIPESITKYFQKIKGDDKHE